MFEIILGNITTSLGFVKDLFVHLLELLNFFKKDDEGDAEEA